MTDVIGLSGYARAGKDSVAKMLVEYHGFTAVAYADLLRSCVEALNPILGVDNYERVWRYQDALHSFGYEGAKESFVGDEFRGVLQRMGTEVGRKKLGDNIWVEATMNSLVPGGRYVITDCRFPNEAQAVLDKAGYVVRVNRPGYGPANAHPSETSLDDWLFDWYIPNDGTLEQLSDRVALMLHELGLS